MIQVRNAVLLFALILSGSSVASRTQAAAAHKANPGAAPSLAIVKGTRSLLGATCTVVAEGRADSAATSRSLEDALDAIARLEDVIDMDGATREIARLNSAAGERFACSPDLYAAIDSAMCAAAEVDGFYDPTIEPLSRAWDVRGAGRVPAADEIAGTHALVGWRTVFRDPKGPTVRLPRPGMGIDLEGIGRGYALERLAGMLRERGIARVLADFGGEVLAVSNREPWQVTVARPGDPGTPAVRIALTNATLSTAFQPPPGVRPGDPRHLVVLDPRTGWPVRTEASVSVVARSSTRAAALSRALLVMGRERAAAFTAAHAGLGVLWLEPGEEGLHAWAWNLPSVAAEPGVNIRWMTRP